MRIHLLLLIMLLFSSGCKNGFLKKDDPSRPVSRPRDNENKDRNDPWWKNESRPESFGPKDGDSSSDVDRASSRGSQTNAILAGRLVDDLERPVADAFIQVTPMGESERKPIGVNTDRQGLFVIEGLRPGKSYELSARVDQGSKVLGNTVVVRAPNAKIFMKATESGVSSLTPSKQPSSIENNPFTPPEPKKIEPTSTLPVPDPINGDPLAPNRGNDYSPSGNPLRNSSAPPQPPPPTKKAPNKSSNVAEDPNQRQDSIPANIPGPTPVPSRYPNPNPPAPPPRAKPKPVTSSDSNINPISSETSAPSFDFVVRGISNESDWKFSNASGRLILVDFWSTTCGPCLRSLPEVNQLATLYTASGLEIIGIACEAPDSFETMSRNVATVSQKNRLKYGVYLDGPQNQAQKLFQVRAVPTMILLDRKGNVLWRGTGSSRENFVQLEEAIKRNLARR